MSTDNLPQLPPPPAQTRAPAPRLWPLWLLALLLLAAVAALAWTGWQQVRLAEVRATTLQALVQQQQEQLMQLERRQQSGLERAERGLEQASGQIRQLDRQVAHTARQVLEMGAKGRTDWLVAEAEYLLRLANQRLRMERDPQGALAILKAADEVLAETDDVALYPVRRQLAQEILSLEGVGSLDRTGLFLRLEAMNQAVDQLQQRLDDQEPSEELAVQTETSPETGGFRETLSGLWQELRQLVIIRRLDQPAEPLLPPEDIFFLRQNLRLMLQQAELALLEKNQALYDASLGKAFEWVKRYFTSPVPGDNAVAQAFLNNLESLRRVNVSPELPDISESLRLLKSLAATLYEKQPQGQAPRSSSGAAPDAGSGAAGQGT